MYRYAVCVKMNKLQTTQQIIPSHLWESPLSQKAIVCVFDLRSLLDYTWGLLYVHLKHLVCFPRLVLTHALCSHLSSPHCFDQSNFPLDGIAVSRGLVRSQINRLLFRKLPMALCCYVKYLWHVWCRAFSVRVPVVGSTSSMRVHWQNNMYTLNSDISKTIQAV